MMIRALLLSIVVSAFVAAAHAASVSVVHGNIVLNGKAITASGHDSDPVLSPDGKRVVFQRKTGGKLTDCAADGSQIAAAELWAANADGSTARRLLAMHIDPDMHKVLCDFENTQFSSNGQLLYFETPAWATSGAIHVYDFKTGKERFFIDGNGAQVLSHCTEARYRDHLAIAQHRYFVFGGSFDWIWLFSPAGKEIGPVGEDDAMLKDACG